MKKRWAIILTVLVLIAALAGCGGAKKAGEGDAGQKGLTVGWPYEPASMDPHRANEDAAYDALRMMGEGLVRNVNGEAVPGVAKSWEASADNMQYTFHLRKSVYSDGSPVTANDFAYGLFRLLDADKAFEKADSAFIIKNAERYYNGECEASEVGIEVKNDYTLVLTLAVPTFPVVFADWPFFPMNKDFVEKIGDQYGTEAQNMLTNGPFTLTAWEHDSKLVLVKNGKYWNADAVKLSEIDAVINATGDTAVDMMLVHELDLVELNNRDQAKALTDSGFSVTSYASSLQYLHINHLGKSKETGRFLSNANFRRALCYAIDRQALVATVYTTDSPASRLTAPNEVGKEKPFNEEFPYEGWPVTADPAKAREYLAKALQELGVSADRMPTFTMLCYESQGSLMALQAIQDMLLKNLGITCVLDPQPIQQMIAKVYGSDYDFWKGGVALGAVDWLEEVAKSYYSTIGAPYNYSDPQYDALYDRAAAATAWSERKDRMFELEKYFCDNVVDLVLTWQQIYVVYDPKVRGMHLSTYLDYTFADIEN